MVDQTAQLYKLAITPSGRRLWTYLAAILVVTEMDQGKPFQLRRFLKNFQTHLDGRRIERVPEGFRLTRIGQDYFQDRYRVGNPQHIERAEVERMISSIRTGRGEGDWVPLA
ncbi:hypothetical protein [Aquipseudomonas alcaligenes]|uniref:Uncharacterized protein n=1 Tax=Aquipseudomonas alcaligenes (strain ATCC 14909 / DSM 50342 / CCUG 1425 / JCM 20561 / NBRC 14159 / NCIMB 9945 / NCTC 10367 / 1577) TaxID=1215092 RepID=U3B360_AQUA1|nr:hypothetical protein [Pseudomonas alcaligenes]GAD61328.1 hypothetical protein PA6_005_02170 [Pseudomonas alcaligenes NBRC 14159]SUD14404.1 Uncharacterised protein [Pseudomonas alcaligenes]